jgi:hypothetical protein
MENRRFTGNVNASPGDKTFSTIAIIVGIGIGGYVIYSWAQLKTIQGGEIVKPVGQIDCTLGNDKDTLNSAVQSIINECGQAYASDQRIIAAMSVCKNSCDFKYMYAAAGNINGWGFWNGDLFWQLAHRLSSDGIQKVQPYMFEYAGQIT